MSGVMCLEGVWRGVSGGCLEGYVWRGGVVSLKGGVSGTIICMEGCVWRRMP